MFTQLLIEAWKVARGWNTRAITLTDVLRKNIFLADISFEDDRESCRYVPEVNLLSTLLREDRS